MSIKIKLTKQNFLKALCILYFGGFILARHQMPTQQLTPLLNRTGGDNNVKKLVGQYKDREITHSHGQNRPDLRKKINLLPIEIDLDIEKQR